MRETGGLELASTNTLELQANRLTKCASHPLTQSKNWQKSKETLCKLCKKADKSIDHIVSGCSKLAQKEYKRRHETRYADCVRKLIKV